MSSFAIHLQAKRDCVDVALSQYLDSLKGSPKCLQEAMRYAVLNGGKRLRPLLVYMTGETLGAAPHQLDAPACAVELIHAYSLVHDDLPAMDNDDLRRGQPTCHKAFDEATAILVGDALQSLAFQLLADESETSLSETQRLRMIRVLANAVGPAGMVAGQILDLQTLGEGVSIAEVEYLYQLKTGALINASIELGLLASPHFEDEALAKSLKLYALNIGLAFQIQDDILDREGDLETLGKQPGSDIKNHKVTYPVLIGLDEAKKKLTTLRENALAALSKWDERVDSLRQLVDIILL